ncbi:UNKNOWN [Stylonychia lemnae]|uniref:Uncharacterized protein n=1 Tax=Stylonychia lemnae TaxID=5949 RepID=A0A078AQR1_STYLE|nr:UNKNOWN [Stylonychia lemnae]|eukprot:CDW84549.1 UNKNOWN [Stylonychia lemnae]
MQGHQQLSSRDYAAQRGIQKSNSIVADRLIKNVSPHDILLEQQNSTIKQLLPREKLIQLSLLYKKQNSGGYTTDSRNNYPINRIETSKYSPNNEQFQYQPYVAQPLNSILQRRKTQAYFQEQSQTSQTQKCDNNTRGMSFFRSRISQQQRERLNYTSNNGIGEQSVSIKNQLTRGNSRQNSQVYKLLKDYLLIDNDSDKKIENALLDVTLKLELANKKRKERIFERNSIVSQNSFRSMIEIHKSKSPNKSIIDTQENASQKQFTKIPTTLSKERVQQSLKSFLNKQKLVLYKQKYYNQKSPFLNVEQDEVISKQTQKYLQTQQIKLEQKKIDKRQNGNLSMESKFHNRIMSQYSSDNDQSNNNTIYQSKYQEHIQAKSRNINQNRTYTAGPSVVNDGNQQYFLNLVLPANEQSIALDSSKEASRTLQRSNLESEEVTNMLIQRIMSTQEKKRKMKQKEVITMKRFLTQARTDQNMSKESKWQSIETMQIIPAISNDTLSDNLFLRTSSQNNHVNINTQSLIEQQSKSLKQKTTQEMYLTQKSFMVQAYSSIYTGLNKYGMASKEQTRSKSINEQNTQGSQCLDNNLKNEPSIENPIKINEQNNVQEYIDLKYEINSLDKTKFDLNPNIGQKAIDTLQLDDRSVSPQSLLNFQGGVRNQKQNIKDSLMKQQDKNQDIQIQNQLKQRKLDNNNTKPKSVQSLINNLKFTQKYLGNQKFIFQR